MKYHQSNHRSQSSNHRDITTYVHNVVYIVIRQCMQPLQTVSSLNQQQKKPTKKIPVNIITSNALQCLKHDKRRHVCAQPSENIWQRLTTKYGG